MNDANDYLTLAFRFHLAVKRWWIYRLMSADNVLEECDNYKNFRFAQRWKRPFSTGKWKKKNKLAYTSNASILVNHIKYRTVLTIVNVLMPLKNSRANRAAFFPFVNYFLIEARYGLRVKHSLNERNSFASFFSFFNWNESSTGQATVELSPQEYEAILYFVAVSY